jgi:hypothetical protein
MKWSSDKLKIILLTYDQLSPVPNGGESALSDFLSRQARLLSHSYHQFQHFGVLLVAEISPSYYPKNHRDAWP